MHPLALSLVALCGVFTHGIFTAEEVDVLLSGLQVLKIGQCIITSATSNASVVKKLNRNFILTTFMREENLGEYLRESHPPDASTAIVMKFQTPEILVKNYDRMYRFTWFLINDKDLEESIRIPFNCQFIQIKKESGGMYRLIENYHIKQNPTFSNEFGVWTPEKGLNVTPLTFYRRRMDMKGVELKRTDRGLYKQICDRYKTECSARELWVESSRILNFSLKVVNENLSSSSTENRPDGSTCVWGITSIDSNGDWLFLNFGLSVRLVTKFRSTNEIGWKAYVKPFKGDMWTAVGFWLLLSTASIVMVNGCTRGTFYRNVFTAFYCLCNSDIAETHPCQEPAPLSTRLVYLMTHLVPAVIVPAYSAYILSTLSIVLPLEPFQDLKSLIADGSFKVSAVHNTFVTRYFQGSEDPDIKYINEYLFVGPDKVARNFSQLFDQICRDSHLAGLFVDTKGFRSKFKCRMFVIEQEVISIRFGFLLQKGSPFRKLFNEMWTFAMYHEKGIVYKPSMVRKGGPSEVDGFEEEVKKLNSLNMSQMRVIFFLIPLGLFLSGLILVVEIVVDGKCRKLNP